MAEESLTDFRHAICARTKAARERRDWTQDEMAGFLGIGQGTYKQYESRTPLPHHFIQRFCELTGVSIGWLLTGHEPSARGRPPASMSPPPLSNRRAR
jgi:transcriptional regulator with XRE-family HTH domain